MKIEQPLKQESSKLMTYQEILKPLYDVFGRAECDCKFNESCICGFSCNIEDSQIKSFTVSYDKVFFDIDGKLFLWPIQKHTCIVTLEEGNQLLENLRK